MRITQHVFGVMLLLASACGDGGGDDTPGSTGSPMSGTTPNASGSTAVPTAPTSCVAEAAAGYDRLEVAIDLGVSAVAATEVGDLNADGKTDLLLSRRGGPTAVLLAQAQGFSAPTVAMFGSEGKEATRSRALKDVNGDGSLDLVWADGGIFVALNDGAGKLTLTPRQPLPYTFDTLDVLDVDGDLKNDVIAYASDSEACVMQRKMAASPSCQADSSCAMNESCTDGKCTLRHCHHVVTYKVNATGLLTELQHSPMLDFDSRNGSGRTSVTAFGDVDKDGKVDIASGTLTTALQQNQGDLVFKTLGITPVVSQTGYLEDLDADGTLDLIGFNTIAWGKAWAQGEEQERTSVDPAGLDNDWFADIDGDKDKDGIDVIGVSKTQAAIELHTMQGRKVIDTKVVCASGDPAFLEVGDFNGDGKVDLTYASSPFDKIVMLYRR